MAPVNQTIYSIALFFALQALLLWTKRRHRGDLHQAIER